MNFSWPFQNKARGVAVEEEGAEATMLRGVEYDDREELDEELDEEGGELDDQEVDPLAELDDETRAIVEQHMERARNTARSEARQGLQEMGLDLSDDNRAVARDPQKVAGWLGVPQQQTPNPPPTAAAQQDEEEEEGEWADPSIDGAAFEKRLAKTLQKAMTPLLQRNQQLEAMLIEDRVEGVMARAPEAIERYAPALLEVLDHPQFEEVYRAALMGMPPGDWRDPRNLARLAGVILPDLMEMQPQGQQAARPAARPAARQGQERGQERTEDGRFSPTRPTVQNAQRAALSRAAVSNAAPSRGGGAAPREQAQYSEIERETARRLQISLRAVRALGEDPTGEAYNLELERDRQRGGRR